MSWNEPGGNKKDPWSGRKTEKGPPDLDEVIRSLQSKLGAIFGSGGKGGDAGTTMKSLGLVLLIALVLWGLSGFYIVDEGNRGVETRFGRYINTTTPGLNWHLPAPIEAVEIVDVMQQRFIEVGYRSGGRQQALGSVPREALMLTRDENIVDVRLAVQYQVKDAKQYLFNVQDPDAT
ncbi:MAG: protease modulator HflK, partial [Pseudomonadota bacterium]